MLTSASSRWPDFHFASSLWARGSPQSKQDNASASGSSPGPSDPKQPIASATDQQKQTDASSGNPDTLASANMAELEDPQAPIHGLGGFDNTSISGEMDQDFGSLEIFDSNQTDAPFSSQANNVAFDNNNQVPTAVMSAEAPSSPRSKRSKRGSDANASSSRRDQTDPATDRASPGSDRSSWRSKRKLSSPDAPKGKRQKKNGLAGIKETDQSHSTDAASADAEQSNSSMGAKSSGQIATGKNERDPIGAEYDIENLDVENLAKEAWNEHINGNARRGLAAASEKIQAPENDVEMADAGANGAEHNEPQPEISGDQPQDSDPTPRTRHSTRGKKAKPTYFEQPVQDAADDNDEDDDAGELPSPSAMTPKPRRRVKAAAKKVNRTKPKAKSPASDEEEMSEEEAPRPRRNRMAGYKQGRFTEDELNRISGGVEFFRNEKDLTQTEVNEMIHAAGGTTAGEAHAQLWTRLFAECPDRHRQKVINITRKKFHNFVARGTWTPDQEAELRDLIQVHGTKWSRIAGLINRHPEDIRDRYRNYVVCGDAQRKDAWNEEEEGRLAQYVIDAMQAIDDLRAMQPSREMLRKPYEELIDWQNISERMDRTRSRLQCITKWKSMNLRIHSKDQLASLQPDARISFNLERARRQINAMPEEERHRLLLAIKNTAAGTEAKIPWQKLVDKTFRNDWHRSTQVLLWHRLKKTVDGWESKSVRDNAQQLLDQLNHTGELPDVGGDGYDDAEEMRVIQSYPTPSQTKKANQDQKTSHVVSEEFITNSDDEGGAKEIEGQSMEEAAELGNDDIQIDPALTQAVALEGALTEASNVDMPTVDDESSLPKRTPSKMATYGKKKGAAKRGLMLTQDPIEDVEGDSLDIEDQTNGGARPKKTPMPSKFKSPGAKASEDGQVQNTSLMSSDFEDMEDLPARISTA
ncbi:unnamed protein product [Clonostachys rosea]|uniref:Uncharacterized protein n=1 Tax=Bionectria ochroleuca TaxID=29856 RepID=A0ABY6U313_BIOOC|nr:unnamed protein product [Clonostachys rosea]